MPKELLYAIQRLRNPHIYKQKEDMKTFDMTLEQELELRTAEGVKALMESSNTEQEWNNNADKVKFANGGYPSFWYPTIVLSGVLDSTRAKWGDTGPALKISVLG